MDYEITRGFLTLGLLIVFIAITGWAFSSRQRSRFEAAAQLPFADDDSEGGART